jgi:two-component system chemotaxis response regulator CheY
VIPHSPINLEPPSCDGEAGSARPLALVVDDSRTTRRILTRLLDAAGFLVAEAGDGQEALDLLREERGYSLLVADWIMPHLDGLGLVAEVRRSPELDHLRILMVTVECSRQQIARALEAGADEYLMKPFGPGELASKLALLEVWRKS